MLIAHSSQYGPGDVDAEWDVMLQTGSNSLSILEKMRDYLHRSRSVHQVRELDFPFFSTFSMQRMLFHRQTAIGQVILIEFHRREGTGAMQLLDTLGGLIERWTDLSEAQQLLKAEYEIFQRLMDGETVSERELGILLKNSVFYCGVSYPFRDVRQLAAAAGQLSAGVSPASSAQSAKRWVTNSFQQRVTIPC